MRSWSGAVLVSGALAGLLGGQEATGGKPKKEFGYESVPVNPESRVAEGFRGEIHPLLDAGARLEMAAHWHPTLAEEKRGGIRLGKIDNQEAPEYSIPPRLVQILTESTVAAEQATYDAHALSAFLPEEIGAPGQMWSIDPERAAAFLKQLHPAVSTAFDTYHQPYGRRPGPAGAFGILRAVSAEHLEILFRLHAEFVLEEGSLLYTPACFLGRMVVSRETRAVERLEMHVPTDLPVNLNITVTFALPDIRPRQKVTNIVFERVNVMGLEGGDPRAAVDEEWQAEIEATEAEARLKNAFYRFMDIQWVAPERMVETAAAEDKPMMIIVLTSPLDDQSC